jgi:hypothetical protein
MICGIRINAILARRIVPFVFVTGYGAKLPVEYAERPRVCKLLRVTELLAAASDIVKTTPPSH